MQKKRDDAILLHHLVIVVPSCVALLFLLFALLDLAEGELHKSVLLAYHLEVFVDAVYFLESFGGEHDESCRHGYVHDVGHEHFNK